MDKCERIIVPVDFSSFSKHALRAALMLAGITGASIHLVHVVPEYEHVGAFNTSLPSTEAMQGELDEWSQRKFDDYLRGEELGELEVHRVLRIGKPVEMILAYAGEVGADLIVIASHGRSGFERAVFGSVAEKVLRLSTAPVMIVKGGRQEKRDEG